MLNSINNLITKAVEVDAGPKFVNDISKSIFTSQSDSTAVLTFELTHGKTYRDYPHDPIIVNPSTPTT